MWAGYIWLMTLFALALTNTQAGKDLNKAKSKGLLAETTKKTTQDKQTSEYGSISKRKCEEYSKWQFHPKSLEHPNKTSRICPFKTSFCINNKAGPLEFPHMAEVGLEIESQIVYLYTASLISENYLLTGAFISRTNNSAVTARFGTGEESSRKVYEVAEVIPHPKFQKNFMKYNIALIRLKDKVTFTEKVHPACLETNRNLFIKRAVAAGWNIKVLNNVHPLIKSSVKITKPSKCNQIYSQFYPNETVKQQIICAGAKKFNGEYVCRHDVEISDEHLHIGNRADCMYRIVGIFSFGNCTIPPSIYSKVSEHIPWIESIVWPFG